MTAQTFIPTREPDAPLGDLQLLLVDDHPAALQTINDMLFELGVARGISMTDPYKALELVTAEDSAIDAVLCDWLMPRMSGLELLRQVRVVKPDLPFVMVTGNADAASVLAAKENGASGFLRKPFSCDELRRRLVPFARLKAQRG